MLVHRPGTRHPPTKVSAAMYSIFYLIGVIVVVLAILSCSASPEVVSRSWWKLGGAGTEVAWSGGSGGEVKVGGRALEGLPTVDPAHGDLTRGEERPEQHGGGLGAGQQALGLDPPLELLV
jgi:hypothetical protein